MHTENIENLKNEASRLVDYLLQELTQLDEKELVSNKNADENYLSPKKIKESKEILKGEKQKLDSVEMVLAVVGTMKAGKSTTINAIVGSEVLPNRNRPMTAIPTLIRHTPKQVKPVMKLENSKPLIKLMAELEKALSKAQEDILSTLNQDKDMAELIGFIKDDSKSLEASYEGEDHIFWILKTLNDLVRLSKSLCIDFPFEDYDEIHELPVIEIEFTHLRGQDSKGTFTLLDTPGPNEAGQSPALKAMLDDQLQKASAVLSVMDYTQLKSEADAEVRKSINAIAKHAKGRLFVLVNKFDQKNRNSDDAEAVKKYVSNDLMKGMGVKEDHVFPVSSRWGYLANQAQNCLDQQGKLPKGEKASWVGDFGEEGFGRRWESKIEDVEEVKEVIKSLWQDSQFEEPLEKVIVASQNNVYPTVIKSAASKLHKLLSGLDTSLEALKGGLLKDAQQIENEIQALQKDIEDIAKLEEASQKQTEKLIKDFDKRIDNSLISTQKEAKTEMEKYFKNGQIKIEEERKEEQKRNANPVKRFLKEHFNPSDEGEFNPDDSKICFNSSSKRDEFINGFKENISGILEASQEALVESTRDALDEFHQVFADKIIEGVKPTLARVNKSMEELDLNIHIPNPKESQLKLKVKAQDLVSGAEYEKTKEVKKRQTGGWGWLKRTVDVFDQGWGYDDNQATEYYVDLDQVKKSTRASIKELFANLQERMGGSIKQSVEKNSDAFFENLKHELQNVRANFEQGLEQRKGEESDIKKLGNDIRNHQDSITQSESDITNLCQDAGVEFDD